MQHVRVHAQVLEHDDRCVGRAAMLSRSTIAKYGWTGHGETREFEGSARMSRERECKSAHAPRNGASSFCQSRNSKNRAASVWQIVRDAGGPASEIPDPPIPRPMGGVTASTQMDAGVNLSDGVVCVMFSKSSDV